MPVTCDSCGTTNGEDTPPLSWSLSMEAGRVRRYCESCTRGQVHAVEVKLDPARW